MTWTCPGTPAYRSLSFASSSSSYLPGYPGPELKTGRETEWKASLLLQEPRRSIITPPVRPHPPYQTQTQKKAHSLSAAARVCGRVGVACLPTWPEAQYAGGAAPMAPNPNTMRPRTSSLQVRSLSSPPVSSSSCCRVPSLSCAWSGALARRCECKQRLQNVWG